MGRATLSRAAFLGRALLSAAAAAAAGLTGRIQAASAATQLVSNLAVRSAGRGFAGDGPLLATLSPGGPSGRDHAIVSFRVARPAQVELAVVNRNAPSESVLTSEEQTGAGQRSVTTSKRWLALGRHTLTWTPDPALAPGTYTLVLTARDGGGGAASFGGSSPTHPELPRAPVVRLLGLDAAFVRRSYQPGDVATLTVAADAEELAIELFHAGPETQQTYANNELNGVPVSDPVTLAWQGRSDAPSSVRLQLGDWPSGLYFAKLTSPDGRVGFAPLVLRPTQPASRIAVCIPTNTWQAYNFYDADGDGYGDSWYVSLATSTIDLSRPYLNRGVPYRLRSYDLGFLHWLERTGKHVDFYADDDLEAFPDGKSLRDAYDLVVFSGHEEYVTSHVYDVVERFRDLGGNLAFLSANNFFRRVDRRGRTLELVGLWRSLGRPEAALCGVQYLASDRGSVQAPYVVAGADRAPWAFAGTGLANGDTFGTYGIEIDARARSSPPGTIVLARIPDLLGPGRTAEMTYYEAPSGARVFSAGVLNFGGQVGLWPETEQILENVWARLAPPVGAARRSSPSRS